MEYTHVAHAIITDEKGGIYLDQNKRRGGLTLVGGWVEEWENQLEAITREIQEETWLIIPDTQIQPLSPDTLTERKGTEIICYRWKIYNVRIKAKSWKMVYNSKDNISRLTLLDLKKMKETEFWIEKKKIIFWIQYILNQKTK